MKTEYKYIRFEQTVLNGHWNCLNRKSRDEIGSVFYYKPWKRFVFEFIELGDYVFDASCLRDIAHFLDQLNSQKGIKPKAKPRSELKIVNSQ